MNGWRKGLALWLLAVPALAGEVRDRAGTGELTASSVEERIQEVSRDSSLSDAARAEITATLGKAAGLLRDAEASRARAAELRSDAAEAPGRVRAIRASLAVPSEEPVLPGPDEIGLEEMEQALEDAARALEAARADRARLDSDRKASAARLPELPRLVTETRRELQVVDEQLALAGRTPLVPPPVGGSSAEATRTLLLARRLAIQASIEALETERDTHLALDEWHEARLALAGQRVAEEENRFDLWKRAVAERRARDTGDAIRMAREAVQKTPPAIRDLARENLRLVLLRLGPDGVLARTEESERELEALRRAVGNVTDDFEDVRVRIAMLGVSDAVRHLLVNRQSSLPPVHDHRVRLRERREHIRSVELRLMETGDEARRLKDDLEGEVARAQEGIEPAIPDAERETTRNEIRSLLSARGQLLEDLRRDTNRYLTLLVDCDGEERQLLDRIGEFNRFVEGSILWLPSAPPLGMARIAEAVEAVVDLLRRGEWWAVLLALGALVARPPATLLLAVLVTISLFLLRRRLLALLRQAGSRASGATSLGPALEALLASAFLSLRWPALLATAGWIVGALPGSPGVTASIGTALLRAAYPVGLVSTALTLCLPDGLAERFMDASPRALGILRKALRWLGVLVLALAVPAHFFYLDYVDTGSSASQSAARILGILLMIGFTAVSGSLLHPRRGVLAAGYEAHPERLGSRLRHVWTAIAVGMPAGIAVLAVLGYGRTASELQLALWRTTWLLLGVLALRGLGAHAFSIATRKSGGESRSVSPHLVPGLRGVLLLLVLTGLWWIWHGLVPALRHFETIPLWTVASGDAVRAVTVASVVAFLLVAVATFLAAKHVPAMLDSGALRALVPDGGTRHAIRLLVQYAIVLAGIVAAFSAIHVGWSRIQLLVAGLSVGLGFGLQDVVANFVAGLVLLFERPIRIGDVVTVGDTTGRVSQFRIRSTTIRDFDGRELVVPNKELISSRVTNWSLSDTAVRIQVPVGVAYGSDLARVEALLHEVAREVPLLMPSPPPRVVFRQFADSSLEFRLYAYIRTYDDYLSAIHAVNLAIDAKFRAAGIEIAFPQRDVHLDARTPIPVSVVEGKRKG